MARTHIRTHNWNESLLNLFHGRIRTAIPSLPVRYEIASGVDTRTDGVDWVQCVYVRRLFTIRTACHSLYENGSKWYALSGALQCALYFDPMPESAFKCAIRTDDKCAVRAWRARHTVCELRKQIWIRARSRSGFLSDSSFGALQLLVVIYSDASLVALSASRSVSTPAVRSAVLDWNEGGRARRLFWFSTRPACRSVCAF